MIWARSCIDFGLVLAEVPPALMRPRQSAKEADFHHRKFAAAQEGDHVTLLHIYNAYQEADGDADWCWENFLHARALKSAENVRN